MIVTVKNMDARAVVGAAEVDNDSGKWRIISDSSGFLANMLRAAEFNIADIPEVQPRALTLVSVLEDMLDKDPELLCIIEGRPDRPQIPRRAVS